MTAYITVPAQIPDKGKAATPPNPRSQAIVTKLEKMMRGDPGTLDELTKKFERIKDKNGGKYPVVKVGSVEHEGKMIGMFLSVRRAGNGMYWPQPSRGRTILPISNEREPEAKAIKFGDSSLEVQQWFDYGAYLGLTTKRLKIAAWQLSLARMWCHVCPDVPDEKGNDDAPTTPRKGPAASRKAAAATNSSNNASTTDIDSEEESESESTKASILGLVPDGTPVDRAREDRDLEDDDGADAEEDEDEDEDDELDDANGEAQAEKDRIAEWTIRKKHRVAAVVKEETGGNKAAHYWKAYNENLVEFQLDRTQEDYVQSAVSLICSGIFPTAEGGDIETPPLEILLAAREELDAQPSLGTCDNTVIFREWNNSIAGGSTKVIEEHLPSIDEIKDTIAREKEALNAGAGAAKTGPMQKMKDKFKNSFARSMSMYGRKKEA
ncbi:hypothetical protein LTR56_014466 [Elasticomyces elasticus]|nr:hypothetical protein LTR56_014466 [Elasticomyces elasticus]KAK3646524.1 hypothetical protein LTR22_014287 [Elasticomyces elasticus]KAK4910449.1 hypothetical protein LTR49_020884 [Elasticomyces elasticus]KAK5755665.1 hypothetical protein LTS12_014226 [Elasticomyces elasticus]